jgi:hypothetical protein
MLKKTSIYFNLNKLKNFFFVNNGFLTVNCSILCNNFFFKKKLFSSVASLNAILLKHLGKRNINIQG